MEWIRGEVLSLLLLRLVVDVEYSEDVDDGRRGTGSGDVMGAKADDWDTAAVRSKRARRWDFMGRFIVLVVCVSLSLSWFN